MYGTQCKHEMLCWLHIKSQRFSRTIPSTPSNVTKGNLASTKGKRTTKDLKG
uniref:Uncharacterized protein n=1 Tax=Rhizophora mucronata TaxID=61149 RepID=A0A2P2PMT0_RHIMU